MKILIQLPESMVYDIKEICDMLSYNRSEFIRHALRKAIEPYREKIDKKIFAKLEEAEKKNK
ncbi:MAG: ribbon-helix-helix domain-containing protein [Candidatus Parvarchaeum sp.]